MRPRSKTYDAGLDVLGLGVGDFVPWLNVVGKVAGGLAGGSGDDKDKQKAATDEAIKKALEQERLKQAAAKAEHDAAVTRWILIGTIGVAGIGTTLALLLGRKRK